MNQSIVLFAGYLQKVLFHQQRSGTNTPLGFDSEQPSPVPVGNHSTPGRSGTAPGSPALLLAPPTALSAGPPSDRPPSFSPLPRDELTVWTGVVERSEDKGGDGGVDDRWGRGGEDGGDRNKDEGVGEVHRVPAQPPGLLVAVPFSSVSPESLVCPSLSPPSPPPSSLLPVGAVSVGVSGAGLGCAPTLLSSGSCAVLPPGFGVGSALSSACYLSFSSVLSPVPAWLFPPVGHCRLSVAPSPPSPLFPTPPLRSPGGLESPDIITVEKEQLSPGAESEPTPPLSSAARLLRPLQIPRLVLPDRPPSASALSPMGPYSPISPAIATSPLRFSSIPPADANSLGPYSPISPARRLSQDPYSPITPVSLPPLGPYSPISPAAFPPLGPYSPISPASDGSPAGLSSGFAPFFPPPPFLPSAASWPTFASSRFLSVGSRPDVSPCAPVRLSSSSGEGDAARLSVAGDCGGGGGGSDNGELASKAGTSKLLVVVQWLCFRWCVSVVVRHRQPSAHPARST